MSTPVTEGILQSLSSAIEGLTERASKSVVGVESAGRNGSGTIWDGEGRIVTAHHVVKGFEDVTVGIEGMKIPAKVVGRDPQSDLAVLKVEERTAPISRGDSESVKVGQFVLALANPFSRRTSATSGIVTGTKLRVGDWWGLSLEEAIISDARVNPGYSGGPLVDASGRMIGLNVAWLSSRAVSIPVSRVEKLVERLSSGKSLQRAFLGIVSSAVPLPEAYDRQLGMMVLSVEMGGPAQKAGLVFGDVLLRFDGEELAGPLDLSSMLTEEKIGKTVKLELLRGGKMEDVDVVLGARPDGE